MGIVATSLTPPAYSPRKTLKALISGLCGGFFGCRHVRPSYPIHNQQTCPDCGAVRDYLRPASWRDELDRILAAYIYATDYRRREEWLTALGLLFQDTTGVFLGEWRKGGR